MASKKNSRPIGKQRSNLRPDCALIHRARALVICNSRAFARKARAGSACCIRIGPDPVGAGSRSFEFIEHFYYVLELRAEKLQEGNNKK